MSAWLDPEPDGLLAVYADEQTAHNVQSRLEELGLDRRMIRVDATDDEMTSMRAEIREEVSRSWIVPTGIVTSQEGFKGLFRVTSIAVLVCVLLAFPFAFIDFAGSFGVRLIAMIAIGVIAGGIIGLVAGPALGAKRPEERLAAQRGHVVRVREDSQRVRDVLLSEHPLRVDAIRLGGDPIDTVATEDPHATHGNVADIVENTATGDDFHVQHKGRTP